MDVETDIADNRIVTAIGGRHIAKADDRHRAFLGKRLLRPLKAANRPERFGVVLARGVQHGARVGFFDLVSTQKNLHPVGHLRDNCKVVGDIDGGRLELLDNLADGDKHLDLGRHIQRRGRLVENDQVGPARHGHCRHCPLKLPARHLMRVAEADFIRVGKAQPLIQVDGVGLGLGAAGNAVAQRRLGMLVDDLVGRVEARRRGLRDIGNPLAEKLAFHIRCCRDQVDPVEHDVAADNLAAVTGEAHGGKPEGGFAGTRFADQPHHLAAVQLKADIVDDAGAGLVGDAVDFQIADLDQRFGRGHGVYSFRPDARCSIQSTTKFTATVSSAMAPAAISGSEAVSGPTTGNGA